MAAHQREAVEVVDVVVEQRNPYTGAGATRAARPASVSSSRSATARKSARLDHRAPRGWSGPPASCARPQELNE